MRLGVYWIVINVYICSAEFQKNMSKKFTQQWDNYYGCLEKYYRSKKSYGTITPMYLMAIEDQSIVLNCRLCKSPDMSGIKWQFQKVNNNICGFEEKNELITSPETVHYDILTEKIDLKNYINVEIEKDILHIYHISFEQTGFYYCFINSSSEVTFVEVTNVNKNPPTIIHKAMNETNNLIKKSLWSDKNMTAYIKWFPWTKCSSCNIIGVMKKIGICYIKKKNSTMNEDIDIFKRFRGNLPCKSKYTDKYELAIPRISNLTTIIAVSECFENCQLNYNFTIKSKYAKKFHKIYKKQFAVTPVPYKQIINIKYQEKIVIHCPGRYFSDVPIEWRTNQNETYLYRLPTNKSNIEVAINDTLIIHNATYKNVKIYSCWAKGNLVGVMHLNVGEHSLKQFNKYIVIFKFSIIVLAAFKFLLNMV